jgi:hypothetical protein
VIVVTGVLIASSLNSEPLSYGPLDCCLFGQRKELQDPIAHLGRVLLNRLGCVRFIPTQRSLAHSYAGCATSETWNLEEYDQARSSSKDWMQLRISRSVHRATVYTVTALGCPRCFQKMT